MADARSGSNRASLPASFCGRGGHGAPGVLLVAIFLGHVLGRSDAYGWAEGALAGAVAVVLAAAVLREQGEGVPRLPIVEWACLHYYAIWVFPVFLPGLAPLGEPREPGLLSSAMVAVLIFVTSVLIAVRLTRSGRRRPRTGTTHWPASRPLLVGLALATVVVSSFGTLVGGRHPLSFAMTLLASPILVLILLSFELRRSPDWRLGRLVLASTATAAVCLGLAAASLERSLLPVLLLFLLGLGTTGKVRLRHVFVAAGLVVFMAPLSGAYRSLAGFGAGHIAVADVPRGGIRAALAAHTTGAEALQITADTLRAVPARVPHGHGETWEPLLVNWIPRTLWPGKPSLGSLAGDSLGPKLGYDHPILVPAVAEGYYNFGWLGVVLAGLAAGFYYGLLARIFDPESRFRYALAVFGLVLARPTGPVAIPLGAVLQTTVAVALTVGLVEFLAPAPWLRAWFRPGREAPRHTRAAAAVEEPSLTGARRGLRP